MKVSEVVSTSRSASEHVCNMEKLDRIYSDTKKRAVTNNPRVGFTLLENAETESEKPGELILFPLAQDEYDAMVAERIDMIQMLFTRNRRAASYELAHALIGVQFQAMGDPPAQQAPTFQLVHAAVESVLLAAKECYGIELSFNMFNPDGTPYRAGQGDEK